MISIHSNTEPAPGPRDLARLIQTRGRIEGFLIGDHYDLAGECAARAAEWLADASGLERPNKGRRTHRTRRSSADPLTSMPTNTSSVFSKPSTLVSRVDSERG
jgi:NADPH-dependent curcumin reductase CurA